MFEHMFRIVSSVAMAMLLYIAFQYLISAIDSFISFINEHVSLSWMALLTLAYAIYQVRFGV